MEASYQTTTLSQVAIWISTLMLPKLYHLFPKVGIWDLQRKKLWATQASKSLKLFPLISSIKVYVQNTNR
jgi:hypothetical protein